MIGTRTRGAGVIGDPVRHSLSPVLHNAAYGALGLDWVYAAFEVTAGGAVAALESARALDFVGLSVTMPHKADAADACDELSPDAAALHSVNTVTLRADGTLFGDSTDGEGFVRALRAAGHDPHAMRVLVLGAGGAARAVVLGLVRAGATVQVAARRPEAAADCAGADAVAWADRADAAATADLVVNATPVGMGDDTTLVLEPPPRAVVADLVYHPLQTPLLAAAAARGVPTVDGLGMLVHQAALQVEQWSGREAPVAVMLAAARAALE